MSEHHEMRLELHRNAASGLDPSDIAGIRAGVLRASANLVAMAGRLESELLFVGNGYTDSTKTAGLADLGQEALLAATLRSYGDATECFRRFRRGEIAIDKHRVAAVLELVPGEPDRWWRALRRVGTGAAQVGVFHSEWEEREGEGLEALEEDLHEWIDVSKVEVGGMNRELRPTPPADDIRMAIAMATGDLPAHPCEVGMLLGNMIDADLLANGLKCILIFAFRPGLIERWEIRGKVNCTLEDLVRAVAAQGPVDAMAVVHPAVVNMPDGVTRRCFVAMVERNGRMGHRLLPLEFEAGGVRGLDPILRDAGPVPSGGAWIGVKPTVDIDMHAVGPVEIVPGAVAEG